jgi:AcrR family transcriptional regulator
MASSYELRRAQSRSAIRQAIVDAAHRLVVEHGMPHVSMSAVAKEAGVSRQTLYNHFSDLEEIILEGASHAIDEAAGHMERMVEAAPNAMAALEQYVRASILTMAHDDLAMGAAGGMSADAEAQALEILEGFHRPLNRILHTGVEDGSFRPDLDPDEVSEILFHMIGSTRMLIAHGRSAEAVADRVVQLIGAAVS